jgi:alpha-glucoside transport system substrate-binding protein
VKRGGAISPNKKVALSDYPDELSRSVGQIMTTTKVAAFDAGDLMPNAMQSAFWGAILKFVGDQNQLDSILADLDKVQATAYTS